MKDVQLGSGGPPGLMAGAGNWSAVSRVFQRCEKLTGGTVIKALSDVTHTFLPSDCRLCGLPMVTLGRVRVCEECVARVNPQEDILCTRCGEALGMESARFAASLGATECTMCRMAPPEFARAVAFANYDYEMREMLHALKFDGVRRMAESVLGERMAAAVMKLHGMTASELVVVPVPLFAARAKERGFNQAAVLAEAAVKRLRRLAPEWKLTVNANAMQRVKDTRALYRLNPSQRRANLRGAFHVADADALRGREVLLVDDIMTTGATARECSRVLLRAGAAKVWVATAAKAQPESVQSVVQHQVAAWDVPAKRMEPEPARRMSF
jgi:ComF family protein